jgi:branched-chain amino acid transport system permease protein
MSNLTRFSGNGKGRAYVAIGLFVAIMAILPFGLDSNWVNTLTRAWIASLAVFSINLLTGYAGLLSFGQAGFVGIGAYTYGVLASSGVAPVVALGAALLLSTVTGLLLALPAARLKGSYLAIGTLGFGVLVAQLLNNMVDVTRGPMGLLGIPSFGRDRLAWYFAAMGLSLVAMATLTFIERRTFLGIVLKSVKHDEIAASACGIAVLPLKLFAFSLSACLAGLSGALYAAHARYLTPDLFVTGESFQYLMVAVVGGIGSAAGGVVATLVLTAVPEGLRVLGETNLRLLVYGMMVLGVLWFLPGGVGRLLEQLITPARQPKDEQSPAPVERDLS